jgi:hypothetical protein
MKILGETYDALNQVELLAERSEDTSQHEGSKTFTATVNSVSEDTQLPTGSNIYNGYTWSI